MKFYFFFILLFIVGCGALHVTPHHDEFAGTKKYIEYDSLFSTALKYKILGNLNLTEQLLQECIQIKPNAAAVYYELSDVYFAQNRNAEAIAASLRSVKLDCKNEWYLLQLSKLYQNIQRIDSSLYYFERLVKVKPEKYDYAIRLAQLYHDSHHYRNSLSTLQKVEKKFGSTTEIFLVRYKNYLGLVNNRKCIETLKAAIRKFPYEVRFYGLLAEHYASIGKASLALSYYKELLKIDPDNERVYLSLIDFYRGFGFKREAISISRDFVLNNAFSYNNKSEIVESYINDTDSFTGFTCDIKQMVDSLLQRYPEQSKSYSLRIDYLVKSGRLNEAQRELQKYIKEFSDDAPLYEQLLYVLNLQADFKALYEASVLGMLTFRSDPMVYLYGGIAGLRLHKHSEAIEMLSAGLKFTEGTKSVLFKFYMYLGECYNAIKDYAKSDLFFESALGINSKDPLVLNNYSYYLAYRNDRLDRALLYINRCLEMDPKNYLFLDTYALILYRIGNLNEAKKAIEDAISYGGDRRPVILEHYCEILMSLNKKDEAIKYYYKLKESGRNTEGMKAILNIKD